MRYSVTEENNVFYFETETQNKVSVEFSDLTSVFESVFPIYCVDIYRSQNVRHANERLDCALVAFIDTSTDKKGRARKRLFKSWFDMFATNEFLIEPREIIVSESESYSFLIIRKSYGNAATLIEAFDTFIKLANEPEI